MRSGKANAAFKRPSGLSARVVIQRRFDAAPRHERVSAFMNRRPGALRRLQEEEPSNVFLCTPVAAEIHFGLSRLEVGSHRRRLLEEEFRRLRAALGWVDWREAASIEFGRWKARLQERGTPIEDMDLAIASVALGLPARLATLNIRHFAGIDDLELVDWSAPHPDP